MVLEVKSITKQYKGKTVLKDVSFSIEHGEIVGLVGPNGAGKTTLLNVLTGMISPTSGTFQYEKNQTVSASISRKGFFSDMSVANNLKMYSDLLSPTKIYVEKVMDQFAIDFGSKLFGKLSAGMKQRVALASAFMKPHSFLLLDEPTNHLDIDSILSLRGMITQGKERGNSFLITSHVFSDLEKVCDKILFLNDGVIAGDFTLADINRNHNSLEEAYINILKGGHYASS